MRRFLWGVVIVVMFVFMGAIAAMSLWHSSQTVVQTGMARGVVSQVEIRPETKVWLIWVGNLPHPICTNQPDLAWIAEQAFLADAHPEVFASYTYVNAGGDGVENLSGICRTDDGETPRFATNIRIVQ